jgi:predicted nuclease of restriction endonuclease-like (RecB) superfamily
MSSAKKPTASRLPSDYVAWLTSLKERVRSAQLKAATRVNRELILLYWDIGHAILRNQRNEGWGTKVLERLAVDLHKEFPEMEGLSLRNLKYMRAFAEAWDSAIVQQPVALLDSPKSKRPVAKSAESIVQQAVARLSSSPALAESSMVQQPVRPLDAGPPEPLASLPWGHQLVLLNKLKSRADRLWYAQAAVTHGWSRSILTVQIAQRAHSGAGQAVTNFAATLPPLQSDLAQQTLKDPYIFRVAHEPRHARTAARVSAAHASIAGLSRCCRRSFTEPSPTIGRRARRTPDWLFIQGGKEPGATDYTCGRSCNATGDAPAAAITSQTDDAACIRDGGHAHRLSRHA